MTTMQHAVDIAASPAEVYPWVAEARRRPQWLVELEVVDAPEGALASGESFFGQSRFLGQRFVGRSIVEVAEAPGLLAEEVVIGVRVISRWTLEPHGPGATHLVHHLEVDLPRGWLGRPVGWLLARWLGRMQRRSLGRLRALVALEGSGPATGGACG